MFKAIVNNLAASDGGSLALILEREDGSIETLGLNRSIESRGTPHFNKVSSSEGVLQIEQRATLASALEKLQSSATAQGSEQILAEFISVLRGGSGA